MRCTHCDYPLWNLTARACPECGATFRPSEYDFAPNTVRFCCPHCDQPYYGTGDRGHLVPRSFPCVSCGRTVDMDEMVLRPGEGVTESRTRADPAPWTDRERGGLVRRWLATVGQSMVMPQRLARGLAPSLPARSGWGFLAMTWAVAALGGLVVPFGGLGLLIVANGDPSGFGFMVTALLAIPITVAVAALYVLLWGATAHAILRATGDCAFGIGRTYAMLCFAGGASVLVAVPCLGPYCGTWIAQAWWVVIAILMVMDGQRVSGLRASGATLFLPAVSMLAGVVVYFVYIALVIPAITAGGFGIGGTSEAQSVTSAVVAWSNRHGGAYPGHGLRLVVDGDLSTIDFIAQQSSTFESDVPLGDGTLEDAALLGPNEFGDLVDAAEAALPADVIAHRVGDYVFTGHGIDLSTADPGLWIVIESYDPDAGNTPTHVTVGTVGGAVRRIPLEELDAELATQNALRQTAGLAPLPDPSTVTRDAPARAGPAEAAP